MVAPTGESKTWQTLDYSMLAVSFVPAAIVTWGIHECAHWLMGILLGYEMWITLNQVGPVQGSLETDSHRFLVAMAGPVMTWLQAAIALLVVLKYRELWAYSFLFLAFWMRAMAMGISFISNPNDEARASLLLGMPMWVLPTISVSLLFYLTWRGHSELKPGWIGSLVAFVMASTMTTIIIFADQYLFAS